MCFLLAHSVCFLIFLESKTILFTCFWPEVKIKSHHGNILANVSQLGTFFRDFARIRRWGWLVVHYYTKPYYNWQNHENSWKFSNFRDKNNTEACGDPGIGSVARGMELGTILSGSEVPWGRTTRVALENCSRQGDPGCRATRIPYCALAVQWESLLWP